MNFSEYVKHDAVGLASCVARGEVTASELLALALGQHERAQPKTNAIIRMMESEARAQLQKPLTGAFAGVPFLIKDIAQDYAGLPTSAGSRALRGNVAAEHAHSVRCYLEAGLVIFGKTNLPELGLKGVSDSQSFGRTCNPWNVAHTPGGSSGGAAAAVASGVIPMAAGNDGGGSIRIPAACCGITGLKTTWGRIPLAGVRPLASGLDTVGPMARDVAGVAAGMALLEPGFTVASAAPRSVGVLAIDADPRITAAIDDALRTAEFDLVPVRLPDLDEVIAASITVLDAQAWEANKGLVAAAGDQLGTDVRDRLKLSSTITPAQVTAAEAVITRWRETLVGLWHQVDLLAAPSLLGFPPLLDEAHLLWKLRALTSPVNTAGVPSLALPVPVRGRDAGPIPANVQLIGPGHSEERLLAAGARLEQAVRA